VDGLWMACAWPVDDRWMVCGCYADGLRWSEDGL
jgi:hypothetical protein